MSDVMRDPGDAETGLTDPNPSEVGAVRIETAQTDDTNDTTAEAKDRAGDVKETARHEGQRVQEEAKRQTRNLVHQVSDQLREQAEGQTSRFAGFLSTLSEQAQALTEGRMDEAGQLGQYAQQLGDETGRLARTIEDRGFHGLLDDVQRFARQRPVAFLLGAGAAGVAVGRLGRGAKDAGTDSSSRSAGQLPAETSRGADDAVRIAHRSGVAVGATEGSVPPPAPGTGTVDDPVTGNVIAPDPGRVRTESGRLRG